jgi:hypothetical protein
MGGMNAGVCHQDRGKIADGKLTRRVNCNLELMTVACVSPGFVKAGSIPPVSLGRSHDEFVP